MAYQQIASGGVFDLINLGDYEVQIGEGDRALLELDLQIPAPDWVVNWLEEQMKSRGIPEARVESASPMLRIFWRKGFPWLAVIVALVLTLAILVIGWRLFREVAGVIPPIPLSIIIILAIILLIALVRRRE